MSMEIEAPRREGGHVHRCLCRLIYKEQPDRVDACGAVATNPDSPLCDPCVDAGHLDLPHIPYTDVIRRGAASQGGAG